MWFLRKSIQSHESCSGWGGDQNSTVSLQVYKASKEDLPGNLVLAPYRRTSLSMFLSVLMKLWGPVIVIKQPNALSRVSSTSTEEN